MKIDLEKRLFVGIHIGFEIKHILPSLKSTIQCSSDILKWIPLNNIHLTLYFLGNTPVKNIPSIIQSLESVSVINHFKLIIEGTGLFPSVSSPKVLWLGIGDGINELSSLHSLVQQSVREFTETYRKTKFTPHITIAKVRRSYPKIDVLPFLNIVYSLIGLNVSSICLYESQLLSEGAKYLLLREYLLN